jgi:enhancing lycopene biosynthesis protein 2
MQAKKIGVVLSGCGHQDGSEIHEATLTLWAIHKNGGEFECFAPDVPQHHVLNHITGEEMNEQRNVLIESARIARGRIRDLREFDPGAFDALILPGGVGAAKNLCTYAISGPDCTVNPDLVKALRAMHEAGKPIGALCIAPVILARVLGTVEITAGHDETTAENITRMGGRHVDTGHGEIAVDRKNKIVTTPCYMLDSRVDQIAEGAENLVRAILGMA